MYARWRANVSKEPSRDSPCLLLPSEYALNQWNSGLLSTKASNPTEACGVSLQFLLGLARSFEELNLEGQARTTQMIVSKFLSPAGSLQPLPCAARRSSMLHQAQIPSSLGLKHSSSLNGVTRAISESGSSYPSLSKSISRRSSILAQISAPRAAAAKETRIRLWDIIDPHWCGKPSYYVSHFWGDDFPDMLATLVDRIVRQPDYNREAREENEPVDPSTIFVWLDVLALPQQFLGNTLDGPIFGPPPGSMDLGAVKQVVCACEKGLVIVLDPKMDILNRVWPLYEVWIAAYYCPQDVSPSRVHAAIPKDVHVSALLHLQTSCMSILDLGRAVASRAEDKQQIMTAVRHAAGQKRMQTLASESILRAARSWLRWSGDLQDMALYVALMLQAKDYTQLQYVLNAVDDIHDDEATLQEIRELFRIYDEDGTGSLEEDEFTKVLGLAGFGPEESRNMFHQADTDGGGSVELDEFEAWWIESQKQTNKVQRPKPELTVSGLVTNLNGLATMLRKKEKHAAAENISKLMEGVKALAAGPKSPFPDDQLPPSEVYGDWRLVANTLGFKAAMQDLRPALHMAYGLLMSNLDTLALDSSPAALLPTPSSLSNDPKLQRVVLAWFMALIAELLSRNPRTLREADFFLRESLDMPSPVRHEAAPHAALNVVEAGIKKSRKEHMKSGLKDARKDAETESIITSMVRLKHGKDTIVSNKLVAEAHVSLSTWVAASKSKATRFTPKPEAKGASKSSSKLGLSCIQSVSDFARSYLATANTTNAQSGLASGTSNRRPTEVSLKISGDGKYNDQAQADSQNPIEGRSHSEYAYRLGVSCLAAIRRYKRGVPWYEEEELSRQDTSSSDKDEESSTSESYVDLFGELFDRFKHQELPITDPPLRRKRSGVSPDRHQPTEQGGLEKLLRKSLSQPQHTLPPLTDAAAPTTKDAYLRCTTTISDIEYQPLAYDGQQNGTDSSSKTDVSTLDPIRHAECERAPTPPTPSTSHLAPLLATQTPSMQSFQGPPATDKSAPRVGVMRTKTMVPHALALTTKHALAPEGSGSDLPRSPVSMPLQSDKAVDSSQPRTGHQQSETPPMLETTSLNTPTEVEFPDLQPQLGPVSPPSFVVSRDAISKHGIQTSRVPSLTLPALKHQDSAVTPEQSGENWVSNVPASVVSSQVGNSFAQRVAAAKEQQRVTKPMVQTQVSASDLEALRQRMSFINRSKVPENSGQRGHDKVSGSMPRGLQDIRSHFLPQCVFSAKRDRETSQDQPSSVSVNSSPALNETPSANTLVTNAPSKNTTRQPLEPLQDRSSPLKKSSTGSQLDNGHTF